MNPETAKASGGQSGPDQEQLERAIVSSATYLAAVAGKIKNRNAQTPECVSDLVQRTLMTAVRVVREEKTCAPFGSEAAVRAWLVGILKNTYREVIRHYRARKRVRVDLPPRHDASTPSTMAILNEEHGRWRAALSRLESADRQLLSWRDDEELTFEEMGRRRGCSTSYARRAYLKARASLAAAFDQAEQPASFP